MAETKEAVVRRKCYECGGTMEGRRENYRYTECGLDSVTLVDVIVFHCKCGAIVPEIPGVGVLHERIAFDLLKKDTLLSGEEIRFLRKMAGYSATKLAAIMAVSKEAVSRWENDKQDIGKESDRFLRFVCFNGMVQHRLPDHQADSERILEFARKMASLNLAEVIQCIGEAARGSKAIRLNPEMLAQLGASCDLPSDPAGEPVLQ